MTDVRLIEPGKYNKLLAKALKDVDEIIDLSNDQLKDYSVEEIKEAEDEYKNDHKKLFTLDDLVISRKNGKDKLMDI